MQSRERVGIGGGWDLSGYGRFVVGPQGDHEAVALVDARRHARCERGHRASHLGEPLSDVDFELSDLVRDRRHPGQDVTGQQ
ncbi:hypothetical protein [Streptomyces griseorubiginosus]